ncbi:uncharacterized protein NFIA_005330 [Aspergillus fischeri NRRL 181]|uniref:Uncharacterized protein n=1 Tax=Neosartorya fischeri (strain ATCC 1020 / DSM 3700 / CBS 544.65 / FGSC A1164 / JCM 1740 / NRRL 181 / WB 181) TaxID=331117 RepID=A1DKD2_NEOFI|nr:conserved hypothetical protein [Aspergillus fischeri NRRL 181]EAW17171.1 conserved hypothetical protein [Aspergillus fischeri NRRL 181]KAG2003983.1 hypothetical protein GB937_009220 [Aspergillus fischeri]
MARPKDSGAVAYTPLAAPENAHNQSLGESAVAKKQSSLWARLGTVSILILGLGSFMLVLFVLPLAWLWAESMAAAAGREPSSTWIAVVKAGWTTRAVTICTAILRTVVTTQASVTTAMFAGIILERVGAPLVDGPFYSMTRALNGSPTNLLWTPSLPFRGTGLSSVIVGLIFIEVSVTMAVQFLSTLLVADFGNGAFTETSNATNIRILNDTQMAPINAWWLMPPAADWTFAEQSDPFVPGPKYHDTGHTYRAFLPYKEAAQRTSLRHFHGPVPIVDQRVVCVQPALRDLRLNALYTTYALLSGQIAIANGTYPMLQGTESQSYVPFTCALPALVKFSTREQGQTSLCWPNFGVDWVVLVEEPLVPPEPMTMKGTPVVGYPEASTMFMLLDLVSLAAFGTGVEQDVRSVGNNDTTSSPWVMVVNGTDSPAVRVTACMANLGVDTFIADLHSDWEGSEPAMSWNQPAQRYSTATTRTQLGAVLPRQPLNDRGVLALTPRSDWQFFFDAKTSSSAKLHAYNAWTFTLALAGSLRNPLDTGGTPVHRNQTVDMGVMLSQYPTTIHFNAHAKQVSLFQDTLNQTQSPAVALQALLTRICQMVYYETLLRLEQSGSAKTAFRRAALLPTHWTGFGVGMGLLLSHWVVVVIVAGLFARYTRHSSLGNHWQAVSQVYSKETVAVLEEADRMDDREVKHWVKGKGRGKEFYSVVRDKRKGRVALTVENPD